jgi:hypothetical protein
MRDVAVTCGSPRTERRPASLADGYSFYRWPGATDGPEQPSGLKTRTVEAANFSSLFAGRIGRLILIKWTTEIKTRRSL